MTDSTHTGDGARDARARTRRLSTMLEREPKTRREQQLQRRLQFNEALARGGRVVYVATLDPKVWGLSHDGTPATGISPSQD